MRLFSKPQRAVSPEVSAARLFVEAAIASVVAASARGRRVAISILSPSPLSPAAAETLTFAERIVSAGVPLRMMFREMPSAGWPRLVKAIGRLPAERLHERLRIADFPGSEDTPELLLFGEAAVWRGRPLGAFRAARLEQGQLICLNGAIEQLDMAQIMIGSAWSFSRKARMNSAPTRRLAPAPLLALRARKAAAAAAEAPASLA